MTNDVVAKALAASTLHINIMVVAASIDTAAAEAETAITTAAAVEKIVCIQ